MSLSVKRDEYETTSKYWNNFCPIKIYYKYDNKWTCSLLEKEYCTCGQHWKIPTFSFIPHTISSLYNEWDSRTSRRNPDQRRARGLCVDVDLGLRRKRFVTRHQSEPSTLLTHNFLFPKVPESFGMDGDLSYFQKIQIMPGLQKVHPCVLLLEASLEIDKRSANTIPSPDILGNWSSCHQRIF